MSTAESSHIMESVRGGRLVSLLYLAFVFLPLFYWPNVPWRVVAIVVGSAFVFLPLYLRYFNSQPAEQLALTLAIAALGFAVIPFGGGGAAYIIYAIGMIALILSLWRALAISATLFVLMGIEFYRVLPPQATPLSTYLINLLVATMVFVGSSNARYRARRNAELRLTQDEVRRLASLAERERIGRDLHDLLGHTLSVVVLKSQLAGRLLQSKPELAQAHIGEVERVAREALTQVREAVAGIRSTGLQAELAAARLALLSAEIHLDYRLASVSIAPAAEAALAIALREAVTNVLRHSYASRVEVELREERRGVSLAIADDGRGGALQEGHGLTGMRERLRAVGGSVDIDSTVGAGTRLYLRLPREALLSAPRPTSDCDGPPETLMGRQGGMM